MPPHERDKRLPQREIERPQLPAEFQLLQHIITALPPKLIDLYIQRKREFGPHFSNQSLETCFAVPKFREIDRDMGTNREKERTEVEGSWKRTITRGSGELRILLEPVDSSSQPKDTLLIKYEKQEEPSINIDQEWVHIERNGTDGQTLAILCLSQHRNWNHSLTFYYPDKEKMEVHAWVDYRQEGGITVRKDDKKVERPKLRLLLQLLLNNLL